MSDQPKKKPVTLDDFDAAVADQVVAVIAAGGDKLTLSKRDVEWGVRMLWTLGQVPAITDAAQCGSYLRQMRQLFLKKIGRHVDEPDVVAAFLRTRDGALAMALSCRIDEWNKRTGN